MNSSNCTAEPPRFSGRVIMGCDSPGPDFVTIQEIEGRRKPRWDEATEAEYMERCRQRAQDMAREIIAQALQKAAQEAEAIRGQAQAEVDKAVAEAQAQLDAEFAAQTQAMAALLDSIQAVGQDVWQARRKDFATLTRSFTRKALAVEMEQRRAEILERLMDEACSRLEAHREFTLRVSPADYELAKAFMEQVRAGRPDLGQWKLVADASLALGGVALETSEMLADNALGNRVALLDPYLEQLGLPEDLEAAREECHDAQS